MAIYALTGGATGIGAALRAQLLEAGHRVISVDIKDGDIVADLSSHTGRGAAVAAICERAPGGLDGFIPCAGLAPVTRPLGLIPAVNYFAAVELAEGLRQQVAMRRGTILLVASNSAPMVPPDDPFVALCLAGDEAAAVAALGQRDGHTAYAGSKRALTTWMRRRVVDYASEGVRLNAIAPGITMTPLTQQVLADQELGQVIRDFGDQVPWGGTAQPDQIASVMRFLLSPESDFMCGSVVFVDGGSDAMLRPEQF